MSQIAKPALTLPITKTPRVNNKPHLEFIASLPCVICLTDQMVQACHIRLNDSRYLKHTGFGEKPDDIWTIPMCFSHHDQQTKMGDGPRFWEEWGFDPHSLAMMLGRASPDIITGTRVIQNWNAWLRHDGRPVCR